MQEYLWQQAASVSSKHGPSTQDLLTEVTTGGATMGEFAGEVLFNMEKINKLESQVGTRDTTAALN